MKDEGVKAKLREFLPIKQSIADTPQEVPRNLMDMWALLVGRRIGNVEVGGVKQELESKLAYGSRERRELLVRLDSLLEALDRDSELQEIANEPIIRDLREMTETLAEENETLSTFVFGDDEVLGLFDQDIGNNRRIKGILHEIVDASLSIYQYEKSMERLAEMQEEMEERFAVFVEKLEKATDDLKNHEQIYQNERMRLDEQKSKNREMIEGMEREILDAKGSAITKILEVGKAAQESGIEKVSTMGEAIEKSYGQESNENEEVEEKPKPKKKWGY